MKTNEEKLAIYRAYLEGKEIEIKYAGGPWVAPNDKPSFDYSRYDYRIKPDSFRAVARAYMREDGMMIWVVGECPSIKNCYQRLPEFDLVANP